MSIPNMVPNMPVPMVMIPMVVISMSCLGKKEKNNFGNMQMSSVASGFSSIKIDYSDYPKSLISRINEVMLFQ